MKTFIEITKISGIDWHDIANYYSFGKQDGKLEITDINRFFLEDINVGELIEAPQKVIDDFNQGIIDVIMGKIPTVSLDLCNNNEIKPKHKGCFFGLSFSKSEKEFCFTIDSQAEYSVYYKIKQYEDDEVVYLPVKTVYQSQKPVCTRDILLLNILYNSYEECNKIVEESKQKAFRKRSYWNGSYTNDNYYVIVLSIKDLMENKWYKSQVEINEFLNKPKEDVLKYLEEKMEKHNEECKDNPYWKMTTVKDFAYAMIPQLYEYVFKEDFEKLKVE